MSYHFSLPEKSTRNVSEFEFIDNPSNKTAKLGVGSFATVKLAREKKTGRQFALKIVNISPLKSSTSDIHNLKVEITVHRKIEHENIIKFHDYMQADPNVYLILDYAENGNLYSYHHRKKILSETEIFRFFHQACLAISYLHKNNIMHRDIKPENLLLDKDYNIKLCDFGWSTQNINEKRLTLCGTYEYMAPEIVHKTPYDYRIDIWALGVLLFELIHGEAPFRGRNITDITRSLSSKTMRFSSSISPHAKDLIINILKTNPSERLSLHQIFNHTWVLANLNKPEKSLSEPLTLKLQETKNENKNTQGTSGAESKTTVLQQNNLNNMPNKGSINHGASFSMNSLTPSNQYTLKYQNVPQPSSLNQISSDITPSSTTTGKTYDPLKLKIYANESPAKENAIHPIKSPSTGQFSFVASGNLSSRDKENKDFISFAGLSDLRRRENTSHHYHSFVNLKTLDSKYPATTTHFESKEMPNFNRQHSESLTSRPGGAYVDKTRVLGTLATNHLSPTYKTALADIKNLPSPQITGRNEPTQTFSTVGNLTQRAPLQNISLKGLNSPSNQTYTNPFRKENYLRSPVENARKGLGAGTELKTSNDKYHIGSSQMHAIPFLQENRSPSTVVNTENKFIPTRAESSRYQQSREPDFTYARGPKYHNGDELVPSLTASFCGPSLPVNGSNQANPSGNVEENVNAKNPFETEINAFSCKPEDDQHAVKQSFTQCYRGIEAKKKIDIDRLPVSKKI